MNYGLPHGVLLFFDKGKNWQRDNREEYLSAQKEFYDRLEQEGKVLQRGQLVHESGLFISLSIVSDAELCTILDGDPAVREEVSQVIHAVPVMF